MNNHKPEEIDCAFDASDADMERFHKEPGAAASLAGYAAFRDWPLVVLTDQDARAAASSMNFLWTTFTRFEPAADIHAADRSIVPQPHRVSGPVVIDARLKPGFPRELTCREDIAQLVTRRWQEYFPSRRVEMGDSECAHLD